MILKKLGPIDEKKPPLELVDVPVPVPREGEILIKVSACGVCHTELDEIEGRMPPPRLPVILGHQVVGRVERISGARGARVGRDAEAGGGREAEVGGGAGASPRPLRLGDRVGVAWIYSACGKCAFCREGLENLCVDFRATGRDADGGYAEYMTVREDFAHLIPEIFSDAEAAPLLCAGAIGFRSLALARLEDGRSLGLTGFGASAHLVLMVARHRYPRSKVFVFSRSEREREFALELGASWAGDIGDEAPERLSRIIDTTPAWRPVVEALKSLEPGGRLVINAIRKEDVDKDRLSGIEYPSHLWMEKEIKSVANVARRDVREFLALAGEIPIRPEVEEFALEDANEALLELKTRKIRGAKVLRIS